MCDPHPFNADNMLNVAYYRWSAGHRTGANTAGDLVYWRYGDGWTNDTEAVRNRNPYTIPNSGEWFSTEVDTQNLNFAETNDEALSQYCVCDVGYGRTPVEFSENKPAIGELSSFGVWFAGACFVFFLFETVKGKQRTHHMLLCRL
jgi:hypothetical protein